MRLAELCKGSTPDSDSVCEGSNPSSAAISPQACVLLAAFFYDLTLQVVIFDPDMAETFRLRIFKDFGGRCRMEDNYEASCLQCGQHVIEIQVV